MDTNTIIRAEVNGLQVSQLFKSETTETLLITLEKNKLFPKHTSPRETLLIVIKGSINFNIQHEMITLKQHQIYTFQPAIEHHVTANEDSKFLIIR